MAGRKADPNTQYRVYLHKDKHYRYAAVQVPKRNEESHRLAYKIMHLGTVSEDLVFTPNAVFRMMPVSERVKYIFPGGWNTSKADKLNAPGYSGESNAPVIPDPLVAPEESPENRQPENIAAVQGEEQPTPSSTTLDQYNNRLYGAFWLLEEISRNAGLYDDLLKTFGGNIAKTQEVLSLAFYPYLSGKNFNRFAKWQRSNKTLLDYQLKAPAITRLTQSVTDNDRMTLIGLRLKRLPDGACLDCDSTTRSAWGECLADIHWGKNKDNGKLRNTVEVIVYSVTTHEPVYYRSFPGNASDMSTIRTILADLTALGIKNVVFTADRGYSSAENIAAMVSARLPFVFCAKTCASPIAPLLLGLEYDSEGIPKKMEYDPVRRLYCIQIEVPAYTGKLSDGSTVKVKGLKANLFLNLRDRVDELTQIKLRIEDERIALDMAAANGEIPGHIKKYNALFSYFKVSYKRSPDGKPIGIEYAECAEKIKKEKALCGFFSSLMYKQDLTALEALALYKERDEHEKNFDQMKNQMHFRVQRNSSEDGKNGRSLILFVGLIPISKLRNAWIKEMSDDYESTLDMLDEMESIRFSEYTDGTTHMTSFTLKQVRICEACGVTPPMDCLPSSIRKAYERKANPQKRGPKPKGATVDESKLQ